MVLPSLPPLPPSKMGRTAHRQPEGQEAFDCQEEAAHEQEACCEGHYDRHCQCFGRAQEPRQFGVRRTCPSSPQ
jgi:hypothetical protein